MPRPSFRTTWSYARHGAPPAQAHRSARATNRSASPRTATGAASRPTRRCPCGNRGRFPTRAPDNRSNESTACAGRVSIAARQHCQPAHLTARVLSSGRRCKPQAHGASRRRAEIVRIARKESPAARDAAEPQTLSPMNLQSWPTASHARSRHTRSRHSPGCVTRPRRHAQTRPPTARAPLILVRGTSGASAQGSQISSLLSIHALRAVTWRPGPAIFARRCAKDLQGAWRFRKTPHEQNLTSPEIGRDIASRRMDSRVCSDPHPRPP